MPCVCWPPLSNAVPSAHSACQHRGACRQDAAVRLQDQGLARVAAPKVEPGAAVEVKRGVRCTAGEPPVDRQLVVAVRRLVIAQEPAACRPAGSPLPPGDRRGSSACRRRPASRQACRSADSGRCGWHRGWNCSPARRSCRPIVGRPPRRVPALPKPVTTLPSPSKPPSPLLVSSKPAVCLQARHGKVGLGKLPFFACHHQLAVGLLYDIVARSPARQTGSSPCRRRQRCCRAHHFRRNG